MFSYVLVLRPSRNEDSSQSVCKPESRAMDWYGSQYLIQWNLIRVVTGPDDQGTDYVLKFVQHTKSAPEGKAALTLHSFFVYPFVCSFFPSFVETPKSKEISYVSGFVLSAGTQYSSLILVLKESVTRGKKGKELFF